MNQTYISAFIMAFSLGLILTPWARRLAFRIGALDRPNHRKVHAQPVPRIGGLAITLAFLIPFFAYTQLNRQLAGLLVGVVTLFGVGLIDDIKGLKPQVKLVWQFLAASLVLAGGIGIVYVSNPFNGVLNLDFWRIPVEIGGFAFNILPLANLVSILWMVGMINAVNLLDGLDGLAGGVAAIAALVMFILALTPALANPVVALLSIILLGASLGFLPYNFYPSSIFMGDSGAYVIGLLLALLSIYAGSKIAIGALVLGFAVIDMVWAFTRRVWSRQSPFKSDRGHLHHRLVDSGLFSHRGAVLALYIVTIMIAVVILVAGGVAAFTVLVLLMIGMMSLLRLLTPFQKRRL